MKLEQQVGVRLFNRTTRRLTLTAEGRDFAERARDALRGLDEAVAGVSRAGGTVSGRVRISVGIGFGRHFVLPLAATLCEQQPLLEVEVSLDNRSVDLVAEGFDIGVRGVVIVDSSLIARRVARLPVVLVAAPSPTGCRPRACWPATPKRWSIWRWPATASARPACGTRCRTCARAA